MPGVDAQHAVIEFHDQEDCWVIQDLNTAQGTYVNDCRIQNATVRVQTGDIIRFGYNGTPYEFQHENTNTVSTSEYQYIHLLIINSSNMPLTIFQSFIL